MMVSLRSPACLPLSPLASVRFLRAAGVGLVLRHLHAGLALLACVLAAAAAGICEASALAWLLRAFGVGPVLRRLQAGHASLARLLTAVAAGFGAASVCSRRRLGAAPRACWS